MVLGNQLFPLDQQLITSDTTIFMAEDLGLCSEVKHHKSKIALFFIAMRSYRDNLEIKDLSDPELINESYTILDNLTQIFKTGSIYNFQKE